MSKLLTIVVPVYKTEKYLVKCLDSLIVPQYMNQLEIIVVIDGSPDNSAQIAKGYVRKYPETFSVIEKENGGHGSTINKGLELAKGKYFRVIDSDDWFDHEFFPKYLERLSTATEDVVLSHVMLEYPKQNSSYLVVPKNIEFYKAYSDFAILEKLSTEFFAMSKCAFRTQILKDNELSLLEKRSYEDTFLHLFSIPFIRSFICYDMPIYHYYLERPDQSVKQKVAIKICNDWRALVEQMMQFYEANKDILQEAKEAFVLRVIKNCTDNQYANINRLPCKEASNELKKYHAFLKSKPYYQKIVGKHGSRYATCPFFIYWPMRKVYHLAINIASATLTRFRKKKRALYV